MRLPRLLIYATLIVWSAVCLFPLYWVAMTSLKSETDVMQGPFYLPFVDFMPSLRAWEFILTNPHENLLMRFYNSAVVGLVSTALTMTIGGMALYGLTRLRSRLPAPVVIFGVLATRLLPPVTIILPIYMMAKFTGTLDTRLALIATYTAANLPVAVWLLQPVLGVVASDQEEAAQLDGASHLSILFSIVVPMAATGIFAASLLVFVLCWNECLFAVYLTMNHAVTLPPYLVGQLSIREAQIGGESEEWSNFSAATVLMAVPMIALTGLAQRVLGRINVWRR